MDEDWKVTGRVTLSLTLFPFFQRRPSFNVSVQRSFSVLKDAFKRYQKVIFPVRSIINLSEVLII